MVSALILGVRVDPWGPWEGERYRKEGMGVEERMGRMKGWGGGRDWKEEGLGRRKGLEGGRDREETQRWETC